MAAAAKSADQKEETVKGHRWIWRGLEDKQPADPSMAPTTAEEHRRRIERVQWGPFCARLCPVEVLGGSASGNVSVKILNSTETYEVPFHATLPWYEGLLALETMQKCKLRPSWFDNNLQTLLNGQRQKQNNKEFNGTQYVKLKLMRTAITGPSFIDSNGKEHKHRRTEMRNAQPTKGVTTSTHFAAQDLVGYLPPWEAMIHKKCGLYQDYYLVRWEEPTPNLQDTESGSDIVGCSWEPDECVPDDMDKIRETAKIRWLKEEAKLDPAMVLQPAAPKPSTAVVPKELKVKRYYVEPEETAKARAKIMKMTANPQGQPICSDFYNPYKKHGWSQKPPGDDRQRDESLIKAKWPTKQSEYPEGYGPAYPPGFCSESCDCMEDWHLGKQELEERHQDKKENQPRAQIGQTALDTFALTGLVNKRGLVSGQCYFEVIQQRPLTQPKLRNDAGQIRQIIFFILQDLTQSVPIDAFAREDAESLCKVLVPALVWIELNGELMPSRYQLTTALPWLTMEPSGDLHVTAEPQSLASGMSQLITVELVFDNIPKEIVKKDFKFKVRNIGDKKKEIELLQMLTQKVTSAMKELAVEPRLRSSLAARLGPVCDIKTGVLREYSLGSWLQAMWEAAQVSQVLSTAHVMV